MVLLVGDDWTEDHHDVDNQDPGGRVLRAAEDVQLVSGRACSWVGHRFGGDVRREVPKNDSAIVLS